MSDPTMTHDQRAEAPAEPDTASRRWDKGLLLLATVLHAEARERSGKWAWRQLENGTQIAYRVHPMHRVLQCRIALAGDAQAIARDWDRGQGDLFVRYLGLAGWAVTTQPTEKGFVAFFLEPAPSPAERVTRSRPTPLAEEREAGHQRAREAMGG